MKVLTRKKSSKQIDLMEKFCLSQWGKLSLLVDSENKVFN